MRNTLTQLRDISPTAAAAEAFRVTEAQANPPAAAERPSGR